MKKYKFIAFLTALLLASVAFVSCGDDDNSDNNVPPADNSLVGYWKGFIKASNDDDMALRYNHYTYYYFGKDNRFWMVTSFFPNLTQEQADKFIQNALDNGKTTTGVDFNGEIIYLAGTYTDNGKQFTLNIKEYSSYDSYYHVWSKSSRGNTDALSPIDYVIADGKLTLSSKDKNITNYGYHHTLVGTLDRIQSIKTPEIPEPDPLLGTWVKDNESDSITTSRYFSEYGTCDLIVEKMESGKRNVGGRTVDYDTVEDKLTGNFTIENGTIFIKYTFRSIHYYSNGASKDAETENYTDDKCPTDTLSYSINGNKMTIGNESWTKSLIE